MARKRYGMYLSPTDDAQLVQELDRCTVRGRKSDLLRNYALLGYQRALSLCSAPELAGDHAGLNRALAELFAPEGAPPDFRSAAEFIRTQDAAAKGKARAAAPGPSPAASVAAEVVPPVDEAAPAVPADVVERPRVKPKWGGLQSLVGGSSKDEGGN